MNISVAGITFAGENDPAVKSLRPSGAVELKPEPKNPKDPFAVSVWWQGHRLGYLPADYKDGKPIGSRVQNHVIDNNITTAWVTEYAYRDDEHGFNREHKGVLHQVYIHINDQDKDCGSAVGGRYMRVTKFLKYFNAYGSTDGLVRYNMNKYNSWEEAQAGLAAIGAAGTAMHDAIEADLRGDITDEQRALLPRGWAHFKQTFDLDPCYMEKRFFDSTLMVSGKPDFVGYVNGKLMVLDWKSSAEPRAGHLLQVSIYAKNALWDGEAPSGAMVVAFGADNTKGYSYRTIKKDVINQNYAAMQMLRQLIDNCGFVSDKDEYTRRELENL